MGAVPPGRRGDPLAAPFGHAPEQIARSPALGARQYCKHPSYAIGPLAGEQISYGTLVNVDACPAQRKKIEVHICDTKGTLRMTRHAAWSGAFRLIPKAPTSGCCRQMDDVSIAHCAGEVQCVVGGNGAEAKSTSGQE